MAAYCVTLVSYSRIDSQSFSKNFKLGILTSEIIGDHPLIHASLFNASA